MRRVVLPHKVGHGLAVVLKRLVHHLDVLAHETAVNKMQHCKAGLCPPAKTDSVSVGKGRGDNALLVRQPLYRAQPVAQLCGALESQLFRRLLHLALQLIRELLALAVKYHRRLRYAAAVVLCAAVFQAPARAAAHVVVEAGALLAYIPRELPRAVRQQQRLGYRAYNVIGLSAPAERTEVFCSVFPRAVRQRHPRVLFMQVQPDKWVALVVLEQNVVVRLVLLYERVFQHQRLKLAARDNDIEVMHLLHHGLDLRQMFPVEIAADAVLQLLRLADVYDLSVLVEHDVHARQQRQIICFFTQRIEHA